MAREPNTRLSLPKSLRFEVLKRDKFTCQYCGSAAPDVVLHVDHINPVSKSQDNSIVNLITSCMACNLGKSDKLLSDDSAVKKAKKQMDELQERREQLEMMMEWQRGLRSLADDSVDQLCKYWQELAPGFTINENGKKRVSKWLRTFSIAEISSAMNVAASQYLVVQDDGNVTDESWAAAWDKIPGICRVTKASSADPDLKELYYIRGILRNRLSYCDEPQALTFLKNARSWDVEIERLKEIARSVRSWTDFKVAIGEAIEETPAWQDEHRATE